MKNIIAAIILGCISPLLIHAQPELGYCEQEVDELALKQVPRALKNWKTGNYSEAERYLKNAVEADPEYADALFLLGDLLVRKGKLKDAEALWLKLLDVCPDYKPELAYFTGSIVLENGQYEKAESLFQQFLDNPERDRGYDKEVKAALEEAKLKKELLGNPLKFEPKAIRGISTRQDEYLATISPDQETMYFTRRSKKVNRMDGPAAKVRLVEEFSRSKRVGEHHFEEGEAMPSPFNLNYNEGGPSITADNTELYFTVCEDLNGYKNCDIYYSELDAYGYWIIPRSVGDHINLRDAWESQASVSPNGDALYFASNRPGGQGEIDIYRCIRGEDGKWSSPENLGPTINTAKNEKTPFIHSDSQTLYYSSDGLPGLGGFDVYFSKMGGDISWGKPQNIGYPINTSDDDVGLFVSLDGRTAYFASNQISVANGWDIYQFSLPENARPETVMLVMGSVKDEHSEVVKDALLEVKNLRTKEITKIKIDEETGNYARVIQVKPQDEFMLTAKKKGSAFTSKYIEIENEIPSLALKAPMEVAKLEVGKEYKLNDINFETNSFTIDEVSKLVIDEFVEFFKENPGLTADIQGHTDNIGQDSDNKILSSNRAKAVYDYAISRGIPSSRLTFTGYGESKPIASNDTVEGRAANRRTVFVITSR